MALQRRLLSLYAQAQLQVELEWWGQAIETRGQTVALMRELGLPESEVQAFVKALGPLEARRDAAEKAATAAGKLAAARAATAARRARREAAEARARAARRRKSVTKSHGALGTVSRASVGAD